MNTHIDCQAHVEAVTDQILSPLFVDEISAKKISDVQHAFETQRALHPASPQVPMGGFLKVLKTSLIQEDKVSAAAGLRNIFVAQVQHCVRSSFIEAMETLRNAFPVDVTPKSTPKVAEFGAIDASENGRDVPSKWQAQTKEVKPETITVCSVIENEASWIMTLIQWNEWSFLDRAAICFALMNSDSEKACYIGFYLLYKEILPQYKKSFVRELDPEVIGFLVNALERPVVDSAFIKETDMILDAGAYTEVISGIYNDYEQIVGANTKNSSEFPGSVDLDVWACLHQIGSSWTSKDFLEKFFLRTTELGGLSKASIAEALWKVIADDFPHSLNRTEETPAQRKVLQQYFPSIAEDSGKTDPTLSSSQETIEYAKLLIEAIFTTMGEIDWESVFRAFDMPGFGISDWVVYERLCMILDFCLTKTSKNFDGEPGPITREAIERRILLHCAWANQMAQFQWMRFAFLTSQDGVQRKWYTDEAIMSTLLILGRNPTMCHIVCQVFDSEYLDVQEAENEATFSSSKLEILTCLFHHAKGKNTSLCCILIADLFSSATAGTSDHKERHCALRENRILSFIDTISTEFTQNEYMHHTIPTDDQSRWMHTLAVAAVRGMTKGTITTSQLGSIITRVQDPAFLIEVLSAAPAATAFRIFLAKFEERNYHVLREWMTNTFFEPQRAENYLDPGWFIHYAAQWATQWLQDKSNIAEKKEIIHAIIGILSSPFAIPSSLPRLWKLQVSIREALREKNMLDMTLLPGTTQLLDDHADLLPIQVNGQHFIIPYPASRDISAEEYQRKRELQARREIDDAQMAEEISTAMVQQLFAGKMCPDVFLHSFADIKRRSDKRTRDLLQEVADRKSSAAVPWQKPLNHRQAQKLYDSIVDILWKECPKFLDYPVKEQDIAVNIVGKIILYDLFPKASSETKTITALLKFVLQNIGKPKKPSARKFAIRVLSHFLSRIPQWPHYCKHIYALMQCEPIGKELRESIPTLESTIRENEQDDSAEMVSRTEREWSISTMALDRRSIRKRLSLLDESGLVLPSVGVRQRVAFLLNNLDGENVQQHALEMSPLLDTPATSLLYFAQYLVEKRVVGEPNSHKAYSSLLTRLGNRTFEKMVLSVSYCSIERCLENDSIRTSSSERSTLKNLGLWIGIITLSKDRPVIARELNIQSLLLDGLANGKLIAIVPFVAKLLEGISSSRFFTIQSPWILSIFVLLVELYSLSNIRVNLRFELELLCKKVNISLGDLVTLCAAHPARNAIRGAVDELYRTIDFTSSVDFTTPVAQPTSKGGPQGKAGNKHGMDAQRQKQHISNVTRTPQTIIAPTERSGSSMKPEPPVTMQQNWMENLDIIQSLIPPFRLPTNISSFLQSKRITLSAGSPKLNEAVPSVIASILKLAVEVAVKEVLLPVVERSVLIATSTTRELIRKDFAFDTDDQALEKHLKAMARALASSLAVVTAKEPLRASTRRTLQSSILSSFAVRAQGGVTFTTVGHEEDSKDTLPPVVLQEFIDLILQDNKEGLGVLELVERVAAESAVNRITELSIAFAEERRQNRRLLLAMGSNALPTAGLHPHPFTATLPRELLVNNGVQGPTKDIYVEFTGFTVLRGPLSESSNPEKSVTKVLEQLNSLVGYIETEAVRHYKNHPRQYLSLTQREFASSKLSTSHEHIKKCLYLVPDLVKTVSEEADLLQIVQFTFKNLVSITNSMNSTAVTSTEIIQRIQRKGPDNDPPLPTGALILNLIHESYLLILQSAKEHKLPPKHKDQADNASNIVISAITGFFMEDEQLWELKDLCIGFIRLRLIEVSMLDVHIKRVLTEILADNTGEGLFAAGERPLKYTPRTRAIVEFAGGLVQSCLVDEKIASQKDLQGTLHALAAVASEAQRQQKAFLRSSACKPSATVRVPTYFSPKVTKHRGFVWDILDNWRRDSKKWNVQDSGNIKDLLRTTLQKGFSTGKRALHPEAHVSKYIERITEKCAATPDFTAKEFFQLGIEAAVADFATQNSPVEGGFSDTEKTLKSKPFEAIDAFSEMFIAISYNRDRFWNTPAPQGSIFPAFFDALNSVIQANHQHFVHSGKNGQYEAVSGPYPSTPEAIPQHEFQQQPYFRLLSNLLCAHQSAQGEEHDNQLQEFIPHIVSFLQKNPPSAFPGFTFSWLSILFHRVLIPSLLLPRGSAKCSVLSSSLGIPPGWKSMKELLTMVAEFLVQITKDHHGKDDCFPPHIALLYTSTLRGLLVLLHDFPEFLCVYADSLCLVLPVHFVQMRNIILSAFPRTIRLPDPFTPNLKVDLLPESSQAPFFDECVQNTIQSINVTNDAHDKNRSLWDTIHSILRQRSKAFPAVQKIISSSKETSRDVRENLVISATVLSICLQVVKESTDNPKESVAVNHDGLLIFQMFAIQLDRKGRFIMLNALVDQLRYPNRLTLFCSFVLFGLFSLNNEELHRVFGSHLTAASTMNITDLQEQMTRVLFQRLIGNRPHPWGLLITFIELVKNPRYAFWKKSYVHNSTPALKKLFESVGHSCARQTASDMNANSV